MKKLITPLLFGLLTFGKGIAKPPKPVQSPNAILSSFMNFWTYLSYDVKLYQEFIPLDANNEPISKAQFMKKLSSGRYLPLKLQEQNHQKSYQLYQLPANINKDIANTMQNWASTAWTFYKLEGSTLPDYQWIDLQGNTWTKANTKGKILVLKVWFIGCKACVMEFPEVNKIVDQYKDNKAILFLSLVSDSKEKLQAFMPKHPFKYAVAYNQNEYMANKLNINVWPTHYIIDKTGKIILRTNEYKVMEEVLKRVVGKP
jgi:peroxiredoxin